MRIPLTKGKVALADASDAELLSQFKWHAHESSPGKWYARAVVRGGNKFQKVYMHRLLTKALPTSKVDHEDGNGLNNRRSNLRICTQSNNCGNSKKRARATSRFKGVSWITRLNMWQARVAHKHIGNFHNEVEAAKAYDREALKKYGKFARLNFPSVDERSSSNN